MLERMPRVVEGVVIGSTMLLLPCIALAMVRELAPVTTLLFVAVGTTYAYRRRITRALTIVGIVLYGASWIVASRWGYWAGVPLWTSGILAWFMGIYLTIPRRYRTSRIGA